MATSNKIILNEKLDGAHRVPRVHLYGNNISRIYFANAKRLLYLWNILNILNRPQGMNGKIRDWRTAYIIFRT